MASAVVGIVLVVAVFGSRIDLDQFSRDVAVTGNYESAVPGQIGFKVIESLSSDDDTMTVGVALSSPSTALDCEILDVRGEPLPVRRGSSNDTMLASDVGAAWTVAVVAEDLEPGEYSAACDVAGEPSSVPDARFTVGRLLTDDDVLGMVVPLLAMGAAIVLGGIVGLVGLILLIVGLVRRNKAKKSPSPTTGFPPGGQPSPGWPPPGPPPPGQQPPSQQPTGHQSPGPAQPDWPPAPPSAPPTAPLHSPWETPPGGDKVSPDDDASPWGGNTPPD